jgi:hypothetical protein
MATSTEKNHNKHLDLLHGYKIHLIKYITELEKMDRESEFLKKWNEEIILERRKEVQVIDKILKNMIRF